MIWRNKKYIPIGLSPRRTERGGGCWGGLWECGGWSGNWLPPLEFGWKCCSLGIIREDGGGGGGLTSGFIFPETSPENKSIDYLGKKRNFTMDIPFFE